MKIRLGTRGSALALAQAGWVGTQLEARGHAVTVQIIRTTGDRITDRNFVNGDGKGVFVAEIERALRDGEIDLAVHSMKDLPAEEAEGLAIAAVPEREDPRDVLVGRSAPTLAGLLTGATVGTSSARRRAQLLATRPDLGIASLRGNVDTRLRKLDEGQYDAICLAAAGLHRLGLAGRITEYLDILRMVPPAGQGALALQTRADDCLLRAALVPLHHEPTGRATLAERAVLAAVGGGCTVPLGVHAWADGEALHLVAALATPDGERLTRAQACGAPQAVVREVIARLG